MYSDYRYLRGIGSMGLLSIMFVAAGCATGPPRTPNAIVVEGMVSVRGNEPFTALVLETSVRTYYVLTFSDTHESAQVQDIAPGTFRVSGIVYADEWNARSYAHLRVHAWQAIPAQP